MPNVPQPPDIWWNSDNSMSDFWISGQSLVKENCCKSRTSNDTDMKLGPVTKIDMRNNVKKIWRWHHVNKLWCHCHFFIYGQFGAIWKLDSRHIGISQTEVYFLILYMCVYLYTKFQVSSIILTNFRLKGWGWAWDWGNFTPTTSKWTPKKPT